MLKLPIGNHVKIRVQIFENFSQYHISLPIHAKLTILKHIP